MARENPVSKMSKILAVMGSTYNTSMGNAHAQDVHVSLKSLVNHP